MQRFIAVLAALIVALPAPLCADEPGNVEEFEFVERPRFTDCAQDRKCLDLENFKVYLEMRNQYVWLHRAVPALQTSIELLREALLLEEQSRLEQSARADKMEEGYDEIFPKYMDAVEEAEEAKAMSVFGGGFGWLVSALVVGLASGFVLGWATQNEAADGT